MKLLVAGDWHSELHEEAVYRAFLALGHETARFFWCQYFTPPDGRAISGVSRFLGKLQNKLITGPLVTRLNADFVETALRMKPDAVFVYRGTHITREALRAIKRALPATVLVGYNNDDPFAQGQSRLLWHRFLAAIPAYDLMLAYRFHNLEDFKRAGAKRVNLLRSWFIPERNHPEVLTPEEKERFGCDVVFVGHNEPDGRLALLEDVMRQGVHLRLFGPYKNFREYGWYPALKRSPVLRDLAPTSLVWGEDYNKALCGAKIALCFLSKLNRDTYTRRCFEIPASGTLLLSEYSDDLASMFEEKKEAVFFRNRDELIQNIKWYLDHEPERKKVALAGRERVKRDGHDVFSRMKTVIEMIRTVAREK